jgi:hypothetical protein
MTRGTPDSRFVPGDEVIVTDGPLIRYRGRITGRAFGDLTFGNEAVWEVRFPGVSHASALRDSILAPATSESDDDVMSPLRKVSCP